MDAQQYKELREKPEFRSTIKQLLDKIDQVLKADRARTPEGLGWEVCRDTTLVERLRGGGDVMTWKYNVITHCLDVILSSLPHPQTKETTNG